MIDLHCHLLPRVDDGPPDVETALAMARDLVAAGFHTVAASPHFGDGPGGDVSADRAALARQELVSRLDEEGVELRVVENAEHYVGVDLMARVAAHKVVPVGGRGHWLLVELPWPVFPEAESALFRLQAKGYRLLLAHPERCSYLDLESLGRMVERGVRLQLDLGSMLGHFGPEVREQSEALLASHLVHVVATDLHVPCGRDSWLAKSLELLRRRFGQEALGRATSANPAALLTDASVEAIVPMTEDS